MSVVVEYQRDGKPVLKPFETLVTFLSCNPLSIDEPYNEFFSKVDAEIKEKHPGVKDGALNKVHGDWYEILLALVAHNVCVEQASTVDIMLLPKSTSYDVTKLYEPRLSGYINDLRMKTESFNGVSLKASNPDFVAIDRRELSETRGTLRRIRKLGLREIKYLESKYRRYNQACSLNSLFGYLSVKTSLRPDRRYQIAHEGSLMKALYVHLQTRDWVIQPRGLRYWAAAMEASSADSDALNTVATHSLVSVQGTPEKAVDNLFIIPTPAEAKERFTEMISQVLS